MNEFKQDTLDQYLRGILRKVCLACKTSEDEARSKSRYRENVTARRVYFWLAMKKTSRDISIDKIAHSIGFSYDHATLLHHKKTMEGMIEVGVNDYGVEVAKRLDEAIPRFRDYKKDTPHFGDRVVVGDEIGVVVAAIQETLSARVFFQNGGDRYLKFTEINMT